MIVHPKVVKSNKVRSHYSSVRSIIHPSIRHNILAGHERDSDGSGAVAFAAVAAAAAAAFAPLSSLLSTYCTSNPTPGHCIVHYVHLEVHPTSNGGNDSHNNPIVVVPNYEMMMMMMPTTTMLLLLLLSNSCCRFREMQYY